MNTILSSSNINEIHKYDIWFAALPQAAPGNRVLSGPRSVVVVSADETNHVCPVVTVIPLTSHLDKTQAPARYRKHHTGRYARYIRTCR